MLQGSTGLTVVWSVPQNYLQRVTRWEHHCSASPEWTYMLPDSSTAGMAKSLLELLTSSAFIFHCPDACWCRQSCRSCNKWMPLLGSVGG